MINTTSETQNVGTSSQILVPTDCLFSARLGSARILSSMLRCVQFNRIATFNITDYGLKVTAEMSSTVQATAFLQKELFEEFVISESCESSEVTFALHVDILIECLNIYSTSSSSRSAANSSFPTSLTQHNQSTSHNNNQHTQFNNQSTLSHFILGNSVVMYYAKEGDPLTLIIEESSGLCGPGPLITDCKIRTLDMDEGPLELSFPADEVVNKVIVTPNMLYERVSELDMTSEFVHIELSPLEPYFTISTQGNLVKVTDKMDNASSHIFSFDVNKNQCYAYRSNHFKLIQKTLQYSTKTVEMANPSERLPLLYFLREIASKIPLEDSTVCKACSFLHKFCEVESSTIKSYDLFIVVCACLNLASKLNDDPAGSSCLRDIINLSYRKLHPNKPALELDEEFYDLRDSLSSMELHLLRVLRFQLDFATSHKYLCHYLLSLKHWMPPTDEYHSGSFLIQLAITLHRDFYLSPIVLNSQPQTIALCAIYLAMHLLDFELKGFEASNSSISFQDNHQSVHSSSTTNSFTKLEASAKEWWKVFYPESSLLELQKLSTEFLELVNQENSRNEQGSLASVEQTINIS